MNRQSFSGVVVIDGRRYRVERPAAPLRDPRADEVRDSRGRRVRYEYILPGPKRARVAASTEAIQRLLREVRAGDAPQTECAVCLQDYADAEETLRAMPVCAHAFHHHCISEWLSRKAVCPLCRRELPLPPTHQQEEEEEDQQEQEDQGVDENGVPRSWNWRRVPVSAPAAGRNWNWW